MKVLIYARIILFHDRFDYLTSLVEHMETKCCVV